MKFKRKGISQYLKIRSNLRKRRRSKLKAKYRNILKNKPNAFKQKIISPARSRQNKFNSRIEQVKIEVGESFSLFEEPENVIRVIENLEIYKKKSHVVKIIQIDLSKITKVDIGAMCFLLAKVNEMIKIKQIRIWGDFPINKECKKIIEDSGFLDYMTDLAGTKFQKHSDNFIFKVGSGRTRNEQVGKTIEKSMKFLTGIEQKYPPVYSIVQEICSNSVEWANPPSNRNKNWFLGINYSTDENNLLITFTMTDIGYGILHTLNRKFKTLIAKSLFITKESEILQRAFDKKYGSKTNEANRNKGLPLIKDRYEKKYITDLKVITNTVFLDFKEVESKILSKNLPGTFYSWNIDLECIERWNKINTN